MDVSNGVFFCAVALVYLCLILTATSYTNHMVNQTQSQSLEEIRDALLLIRAQAAKTKDVQGCMEYLCAVQKQIKKLGGKVEKVGTKFDTAAVASDPLANIPGMLPPGIYTEAIHPITGKSTFAPVGTLSDNPTGLPEGLNGIRASTLSAR